MSGPCATGAIGREGAVGCAFGIKGTDSPWTAARISLEALDGLSSPRCSWEAVVRDSEGSCEELQVSWARVDSIVHEGKQRICELLNFIEPILCISSDGESLWAWIVVLLDWGDGQRSLRNAMVWGVGVAKFQSLNWKWARMLKQSSDNAMCLQHVETIHGVCWSSLRKWCANMVCLIAKIGLNFASQNEDGWFKIWNFHEQSFFLQDFLDGGARFELTMGRKRWWTVRCNLSDPWPNLTIYTIVNSGYRILYWFAPWPQFSRFEMP